MYQAAFQLLCVVCGCFFMSIFDMSPADLAASTPIRIATAIMTIVPEGATL